jgi:hypothetical protein
MRERHAPPPVRYTMLLSINGLYKTECIRTTVFHDGPYKTIADVVWFPPNRGGLLYAASRSGAAVFS